MLTDKEYVEKDGSVCPFCGSTKLEGGHFDAHAGGISQKIKCLSCERIWYDEYQLIGFDLE